MRLAHLSDLHVLDLTGVKARHFMNKRITGALNLLSFRRDSHPTWLVERALHAVEALNVDHTVVTGDLTNLSLPSEFQRARQLLDRLADWDRLSVVPGNHDIYTRESARANRFESYFGDLMWRDGLPEKDQRYPWFKKIASTHIVGLCSAQPVAPLMAVGHVGEAQLDRMKRHLEQAYQPGDTIVALIHHNLHERAARKNLMHGLKDRALVLDTCADLGVNLMLHGHTHHPHHFMHGAMAVTGCGSSTTRPDGAMQTAHFNVYELSQGKLMSTTRHAFDPSTESFQALSERRT